LGKRKGKYINFFFFWGSPEKLLEFGWKVIAEGGGRRLLVAVNYLGLQLGLRLEPYKIGPV